MVKPRYFLHSKVNSDGRRPIYLSVGVGETRPVRQATGYVVHPQYFSASPPYLNKAADGARAINLKLQQLLLDVEKVANRLEEDRQLSNAALAPKLKALVVAMQGRAESEAPVAETAEVQELPTAQQSFRAVCSMWQEENSGEKSVDYLRKATQYIDWIEKFDKAATPASVDEKWLKRYTKFLVEKTPLYNNTIHQHVNMIRAVLQQAGLSTKWIKNTWKHNVEKCYLTLEELQQLMAYEPTSQAEQQHKDVFVVRCLTGLRYSDAAALLTAHVKPGQSTQHIRLDQKKSRKAVSIPVPAQVEQILEKYKGKYRTALPMMAVQNMNLAIKQLLRKAGIESDYVQVRYKGTVKHEKVMKKWEAASTHTARHTYGTISIKLGVDPVTLMSLMGHADIKTTMIYVHLNDLDKEKSVTDAWSKLG
jgi:site-specific recombinase XerD